MNRFQVITVSALLAVVLLAAGCSQPYGTQSSTGTPAATTSSAVTAAQPAAVMVSTSTTLGQYLADAHGMTLYYLTKDSPGSGNSTCTGVCIANWPAFTTQAGTVTAPLNASDFSQIKRADGTMQTTYKGWPLYYFKGDASPGDTNGQGINGVWFVMSPSGPVTMASTT